MSLAKNQFEAAGLVWTVIKDDGGDITIEAPGFSVIAFMPENGEMEIQVADLFAKLAPFLHAAGRAQGKEEICHVWDEFASKEAAKAAEALAS